MTANHEHTPSQEMFRLAYKHILDNWLITPEGRQQALGEYDRMIAQVEAAAEQRGAVKVVESVRKEANDAVGHEWMHPDQELNDIADWLEEKYCADQMEDDDETH